MTPFPGGKRFAFTVFDDTDNATVENIGPVYRLLSNLGMRTTKSIWSLPTNMSASTTGESLYDPGYLHFVKALQSEGFEIGFHNARNVDSFREVTEKGLESFNSFLGMNPRVYCQHQRNRENLYWGSKRLRYRALQLGYTISTIFLSQSPSEGHCVESPYFWGDLCQERIDYVRNFVFDEINLLRVNPSMPYHDPEKPYVNFWFSSSNGGDAGSFNKMLSEKNQDRLERESGVCIMYTHFAAGFVENGELNITFRRQMEQLAERSGWFVPVSTLLDHLRKERAHGSIPNAELLRMECKWLLGKLHQGRN